MKNLKLIVAYDGTHFLGWQKTKEGRSVEAVLEEAIGRVSGQRVKLQAASRTDAGVHAEGQVVNCFLESTISRENLNGALPEDLKVVSVEEMPLQFHPTLDVTGKEYLYDVYVGAVQPPFEQKFSWHFVKPIDVVKMKRAARDLVGEHDFSGLTSERKANNRRTVFDVRIKERGDKLMIGVTGDHFLYKGVRTMVGTLLYIGCEMLPETIIPEILSAKDRTAAGMTAPAHGLTLKQVWYAAKK